MHARAIVHPAAIWQGAPVGELEWPKQEILIDGARLVYADVGRGEPIVLLHGYPQSHLCWRHQIGALAASHRVVAFDWLGWGESERCLGVAPEYAAEVDRLNRALEALELEPFNFVTHDYGGFLGLGYVLAHPERVRRFAILNSRAHRTFPPAPYAVFGFQCFMARRRVLRSLFGRLPIASLHRRALQPYVRKGCFDAEILERYIGWMETKAGRRWIVHFFAHYRLPPRPELAAGLARIACPTTVVWGDRDPYCPFAIAEELAEAIPHATLVRLRAADHYVMEERPREVLGALRALLARECGSHPPSV